MIRVLARVFFLIVIAWGVTVGLVELPAYFLVGLRGEALNIVSLLAGITAGTITFYLGMEWTGLPELWRR